MINEYEISFDEVNKKLREMAFPKEGEVEVEPVTISIMV